MSGTWSVVTGQGLAAALAREDGSVGRTSAPDAAGDLHVDVATARGMWPAVLRPCAGPDVLAPDRGGAAPTSRESSARLCAHALRAAASVPVRAIHWFLHPDSTIIAESALGPRQSVLLVGRVPHAPDPAISPGPIVDPGLLLLGTWATSDACARLADLVGPASDTSAPIERAPTAIAGATTTGATSPTAVLTRWILPAGCPPLPARLVTDLRPDLLERALLMDLAAAFARVQVSRDASSVRARA